MADQATSLPIRTEADGTDSRLHVKIVDGTTPAQRASVDTNGNVFVQGHGNDPAAVNRTLKLSERGYTNTDGVYDATNNTVPSTGGLMAFLRGAAPALSDLIKKVTAISNGSVHALDVSLHDQNGAPYTSTNPLAVTSADAPGVIVTDYKTAAALAAAGSDTHDYAVTATKTLDLTKVLATGSGKIKVEVKTSPDGTAFTTVAVGFNSTANPNIELNFQPANPDVTGTGSKVRVIVTNRDNQPQDVYSTILGFEN